MKIQEDGLLNLVKYFFFVLFKKEVLIPTTFY